MKEIMAAISFFLKDRFNLHEDKADESVIIESINKGVEFKGINVWTLIFAILIASIGLNVNSTAVIIGAMLISPLMGPIMGVGLGIGINDIELIKKGLKNLLIATVISIVTSAIYFYLTPLHEAQSELLARTQPSVWDVFIAFVGGLAGIIAGTRKEKGTVIPGVAIATALMPPLCTAGFGIASGNILYFLGALYLFFINSLFICISTVLIVRFLKFRKKLFQDAEKEKKVNRYILILVLLTVCPSIYLAYKIVDRSLFESNARKFVDTEFHFSNTQVINKNFYVKGKHKEIDLLLLGQELSPATIDSIRNRLKIYHLGNTTLTLHQGLNAKQQIDLSQIKASIMEDVFKNTLRSDSTAPVPEKINTPLPDIRTELNTLFPELTYYTLAYTVAHQTSTTRKDTLVLFTGRVSKKMTPQNRNRFSTWLKERLQTDSLQVILE
ncbi:TIGR00341 family protein [Chitinophaga nivalis]|uniref:TIGR00341 family protein n=1 Tax=Chitinophaga nivalis TaxID=2991709 RepID=A0ABT3IQ96_9BACT|nr:TIGR00341 family protein [Chitinophaga nivalis]MCW3464160.1 TIGR00341 family protein [Chitinophaga nivalis]MCW3486150.1 TIGR00341 family protein [Chitinophaga nivalis]